MAEPLRRVGRYDLLEVIGRGGAAVVYLAYQPDLDRQVALKELAPHHAADPSFAQRFVEESRLAASLSNPNIVTVFEYFEHEGLPYIAMEYMPHGSLRSYVQDLSGAQLGGVLESILSGLAYGEQTGIVHRDLKPENLLVGGNGRVKIADFGVARALSDANPRPFATVTGTPIGTPAYMAPEQALGQPLTPATDLYSVGIITWEALAGRTPFASNETPMAVLYQQVNEPIPPIETIRDDVYPGASAWLARMLAKSPEDRYASAAEAWDELEEVLIEMLGPRWRRDADLDVGREYADDAGYDSDQESYELDAPGIVIAPRPPVSTPLPTAFSLIPPLPPKRRDEKPNGRPAAGDPDDGDEDIHVSDGRRRPQTAAVLTPSPQGAPGPELDPLLAILPSEEENPIVDDLQAFRAAGGPERQRQRAGSSMGTRVLAGGTVAVLAAVAGVLIGNASSSSTPAPTAAVTRTSAADLAALKVRPVVARLASGTATGITRFNAAKTPKLQTKAALLIAKRYSQAGTALAALGGATQTQPAVIELERDISDLSTFWRAVAVDAFHQRTHDYAQNKSEISQLQKRLISDAVAAEGASR